MLLDFDQRFIKGLSICPLNDGLSVMRCSQKENSRSSMDVIWRSLTSDISSLTGLITTLIFSNPELAVLCMPRSIGWGQGWGGGAQN